MLECTILYDLFSVWTSAASFQYMKWSIVQLKVKENMLIKSGMYYLELGQSSVFVL